MHHSKKAGGRGRVCNNIEVTKRQPTVLTLLLPLEPCPKISSVSHVQQESHYTRLHTQTYFLPLKLVLLPQQ